MNKPYFHFKDVREWIDALKTMKEERDQLLRDKIRLLEELSSMCEDARYGDVIRQELEETWKRLERD